MAIMVPEARHCAVLPDRALIQVEGDDWRGFLQGLLTQDVESLRGGELRFGALLTPQGRVLFDLFILGGPDGCRLDCDAARRDDLVARLSIYRLRAKVRIAPVATPILAAWGGADPPEGGVADPRLPALGWRLYAEAAVAADADAGAYAAHRLALGVPGTQDWRSDVVYPIEADFDLLAGVDFHKGCFVGQETTSRMKRRGAIRSRMAPIAFEGAAPPFGAELLAGDRRAGEVLSGRAGAAMALLRLDRLEPGPLTLADGRPWRPILPDWLRPAAPQGHPPS